jgi:4-methyl-5(b-hydroxyethyl)-thiazole monophosphate biosynthesis
LRRAGIEVITAGLDAQPVTASRGVRLIPDTTLDAVLEDSFDLIVLPGGLPGADHLDNDPRIQALLIQQVQSDKMVAAICAAPKALASAGLLENKRATAYPGTLENLNLPNTEISSINLLMDGNVTTS